MRETTHPSSFHLIPSQVHLQEKTLSSKMCNSSSSHFKHQDPSPKFILDHLEGKYQLYRGWSSLKIMVWKIQGVSPLVCDEKLSTTTHNHGLCCMQESNPKSGPKPKFYCSKTFYTLSRSSSNSRNIFSIFRWIVMIFQRLESKCSFAGKNSWRERQNANIAYTIPEGHKLTKMRCPGT